jgi:hypothetical protein
MSRSDQAWEEARRRIREKLRRERERNASRTPASPPPRYDDVYLEGLSWLDEL